MSRLIRRKAASQQTRRPHSAQPQEEVLFRRSRTITGSTSSKVRGANEKKADLKSDRVKKHLLKKTRRAIGAALLLVFIAGCGLYYLISQYSSSVEISSYAPRPTQPPPSSVYQTAIGDYLDARPGERFRFALNVPNLSEYMRQKFPEVKKVTLNTTVAGSARFELSLRQPVARWQIGQRQFFVDSEGRSYEKNYFAAPSVNVIDKSGTSAGRGNTLASQGFLRFLGRLVTLTNASGLGRITEASLPPGVTRQIDIRLEGRGYLVKTHTDRDPASEVEDLRRTILYLEQRQLKPSYIDLRVEGKAFYR